MTEMSGDDYLRRIEKHFGQRRGGPLVLSPTDWKLLERWQNEGIPLRIVLRGINQAFDHFEAAGPRADRINSLRYCQQQVETAWEEHRARQRRPGEATAVASEGLPQAAEHLVATATACRAAASNADAASAALEAAANRLDALAEVAAAADADAQTLDTTCNELEQHTREAVGANEFDALKLPRFSPYEAF